MNKASIVRVICLIVVGIGIVFSIPFSQGRAWAGVEKGLLLAQQELGGRPPLLSFTGSLYPRDEESQVKSMKEGMRILRVSIKNKELIFKVDDVVNLTGNKKGYEILNKIFPPYIYLVEGKRDALAPLLNPEIFRKPITIEGHYFQNSKVLEVVSVSDAPASTE